MPPSGNQTGNWTTNIEFGELGQADLDKTYNQLIDFLFPRELVNPARAKCSFVLRFIPANGSEHQLNILIPEGSSNIELLRMEVQNSLHSQLTRSDEAQDLASKTVVKRAEPIPTSELQQLLESAERNGLSVRVPPGITLHGDSYKLWMACELNSAELTVVVSEGAHTPVSDWMNKIWSETANVRQGSLNPGGSGRKSSKQH